MSSRSIPDRADDRIAESRMEQQQLKRILEAALLAAAQPLSLPQLSALFVEPDVPTHEDLARALEQLGEECADRGVELKEVASGFRYQVRQDVHPWVSRMGCWLPPAMLARSASMADRLMRSACSGRRRAAKSRA